MCQTLKRTTGTQSQEFPRILVSCQNHKGGSDKPGRDVTGRGDVPEPSEVINTVQAGPTSSEFTEYSWPTGHHWPHPWDTKASAPFVHCLWFPIFHNNYKNQLEQGIPGPLVYKALSTDFANKCLFSWLNYSCWNITQKVQSHTCLYFSHNLVRALSIK